MFVKGNKTIQTLSGVEYDGSLSGQKKLCFFQCVTENEQQKKIIPLKKVVHRVKTTNDLAQVQVELIYESQQQKLIQSTFNFAISANACFDHFEAQIGERVVKGLIKEKKQAEKEYEQGIKEGKTMAISTIDNNLKDVIQVKLGNIEPLETVSIKLRYLEPLLNNKGSLELLLPFTLTPRYQNQFRYQKNYVDDCSFTNKQLYDWNLYFDLSAPNNQLYNFSCGSHPTTKIQCLEIDGKEHQKENSINDLKNIKCQNIKFQMDLQKPDTDFSLQFQIQNQINVLLQKRDVDDELNKYCAMISISNKTLESVKEVQNNQNPQEFIFILDRSGSMSGDRIEMAKQSLIELINGLPSNSYFNIISFGSGYESLYKTPKKSTQQVKNKTIKSIQQMKADFGGTEILDPLEYIYEKLNIIQGYSRNIFLITDGDVGNSRDIIDLVKKYQSQAYIYSLGIGSGTSQVLITEVATKSNGKYEFVNNTKDIQNKMKNLLQYSLKKKFTDFKLVYDQAKVKAIVPDLNCLNYIRENETVQCFVLLEDGFGQTNIQLQVNGQEVHNQLLDEKNYEKSDFLHKMAYNMISFLQLNIYILIQQFEDTSVLLKKYLENTLYEGDVYDDIYIQIQKTMDQLKEEALEISIKYQILCELTAFICEIKNLKDEIIQQNLESETVQIPNNKTQDSLQRLQQYSQHTSQVINQMNNNIDLLICRSSNLSVQSGKVSLNSASFYKKSKKTSCCDIGGGTIDLQQLDTLQPKQQKISIVEKQYLEDLDSYRYLLYNQQQQGYWNFDKKILKIIGLQEKQMLSIIQNFPQIKNAYVLYTCLILQYLKNIRTKDLSNCVISIKQGERWLIKQGYELEECLKMMKE